MIHFGIHAFVWTGSWEESSFEPVPVGAADMLGDGPMSESHRGLVGRGTVN